MASACRATHSPRTSCHVHCRIWPYRIKAGRHQRSASALGGPAGASAPRPQPTADQSGSSGHATGDGIVPSCSAIHCPAPGRAASRSPCGRRCAIGFAEPRPEVRSPGSGAYQEERLSPAMRGVDPIVGRMRYSVALGPAAPRGATGWAAAGPASGSRSATPQPGAMTSLGALRGPGRCPGSPAHR